MPGHKRNNKASCICGGQRSINPGVFCYLFPPYFDAGFLTESEVYKMARWTDQQVFGILCYPPDSIGVTSAWSMSFLSLQIQESKLGSSYLQPPYALSHSLHLHFHSFWTTGLNNRGQEFIFREICLINKYRSDQ